MVTFGSRMTVTMIVVLVLLKPIVKIGTLHTAYASMIMTSVVMMVTGRIAAIMRLSQT